MTPYVIGFLIWYFLVSWWIYLVAKYGEGKTFPFGAFIPIYSLYLLTDLAGVWMKWFFGLILLSGLSSIHYVFSILCLILLAFVNFNFSMRSSGKVGISILSTIIPVIGFPITWYMAKKQYLLNEQMKQMIKVECGSCQKTIGINKKAQIKEFNCPSCGFKNTIS